MKQNIQQTVEKASQQCQQMGGRLTEKRKNILLLLLSTQTPLSAYDLVEQYKIRFSDNLPAMSVYRMLNFLQEVKLAHKLETTNQFVACSHIICEHEHEIPQFLICDQCHTVREIGVKKQIIEELSNSIETTGFSLASQQLELHGLCAGCKKQA